MPKQVSLGALLKCTFGTTPSPLTVVRPSITAGGPPAAVITDFAPMTNIMPFGMCTTPTNPAVTAAQGAPVPCIPVTVGPWAPGIPTILLNGVPTLSENSKCMCTWTGVISVAEPGQATVDVS
jgi:hypothetical protein